MKFNQVLTTERRALAVFAILSLLTAVPCQAHFLWVKTVAVDGSLQAFLFFGSSPAEENYHFPDKLLPAQLWSCAGNGTRTEIKLKSIDTDARVGRIGSLAAGKDPVLATTQQYGIYGNSLLIYHAKHLRGDSNAEINSAPPLKTEQLEIVPHLAGNELKLTVLWHNNRLPDADVSLFADDADPVEKKTNPEGIVTFTLQRGGLIGALASTTESGKSGELHNKPYHGVTHYASLTFTLPQSARATNTTPDNSNSARKSEAQTSADRLPNLPEPLASFGAVVNDGWLYVYGGHTGEEHQHSAANLSRHFRRLKIDGGDAWEELPMQTPLQGLPLVAHAGKIYRVGGLNHRNPTPNDKEDLHSVNEFAEYDPATKQWTLRTPLPNPRSSHNATVIGDKLYVVGGWNLSGTAPGVWQTDALVYDFSNPQTGWRKLTQPDFKRRALAAGYWNGKLLAIGGMNEKAKPTSRVDIFDTHSGKWSPGPQLPGSGMDGFGVSAWNQNGALFVSGIGGTLLRLNDAGSAWKEAGTLQTPRFFHQLVPGPKNTLLAVGGASENGQVATIEQISLNNAR